MSDRTLGRVLYEAEEAVMRPTLGPAIPWEKLTVEQRLSYEHVAGRVAGAAGTGLSDGERAELTKLRRFQARRLLERWFPAGQLTERSVPEFIMLKGVEAKAREMQDDIATAKRLLEGSEPPVEAPEPVIHESFVSGGHIGSWPSLIGKFPDSTKVTVVVAPRK